MTPQPEPLKKIIPKYSGKIVLDAGAGHLLYKDLLKPYFNHYESMDFEKTSDNLTYITDIQNMKIIKSGKYDLIFCRNVLEHVPHPEKALKEMNRVLKKEKYIVITVPHLGYLHNEPHDYWRFTKYSLKTLLGENNFEIIEIKEIGGFFSFLGYVFQTIFMGLTYGIPVINKAAFWINYLVQRVILVIDKMIGMKKLFPLDYLVVGRKIK